MGEVIITSGNETIHPIDILVCALLLGAAVPEASAQQRKQTTAQTSNKTAKKNGTRQKKDYEKLVG